MWWYTDNKTFLKLLLKELFSRAKNKIFRRKA